MSWFDRFLNRGNKTPSLKPAAPFQASRIPNYFQPHEFQGWFDRMMKIQLERLNLYRHRWGMPVIVSPASGAVGRHLGLSSKSQHNYDRWGEVRATDIMPVGMETAADRRRAYQIAKAVGFTGIGIYPEWRPRAGLHVDSRVDRLPGNPATWSAFRENGRQVYYGIDKAI